MSHKVIGIACIDSESGIGNNGKLLIHDKHDMEHFKELTMNNVVVMGGETFRSLPNAHSLPNRTNVILSKTLEEFDSNMIVCKDLNSLYNTLHRLKKNRDIFVIGGQSIYEEFKYIYDELYITHIDYKFPNKDRYFPDIFSEFRNFRIEDNWKTIIDGKEYSMLLIHYMR